MLKQQTSFYQHPVFKIIFFSSILLFVINLFLRLHIIPFYGVEIGGIEINIIDGIAKILSGKKLYGDPTSPPYDIFQYSPMYYYLVAGLANLLDISSADPQKIFILSRSVALASNLLTFLIIFYIARHFLLSRTNSLLAGIFSFVILTQHYYSRGDSFYCFLFFVSILLFLKYLEKKNSNYLLLCVAASVCCILTKQSGILLPIVITLFLILNKDFKAIGIIAVSFLVLSLIFLIFAGKIGGIESIYRNVVLGVKNGMSFYLIESFFNDKYYRQASLWVIIGFYLSFRLFKKSEGIGFYFILFILFSSLIFAFVTGLKIGASLNYFIECFMLTFLAGLIYVNKYEPKIFRSIFYVYFILSIAIKTAELFSAIYISHFRSDQYENYIVERDVCDYMLNKLHLKNSEYVYLNFRGYSELFLQNNSILNQKDVNCMVAIFAKPEIDFTSLLENADAGLITYIIAIGPFEKVELLGRYFKNFQPVKSIGKYTIYRFKNQD